MKKNAFMVGFKMLAINLSSLEQTKAFACHVASLANPGDVITLQGDLGAGKSEFARAFIKSLAGQSTVVPSPTFTILEQYQTPSGLVSHFDLYRLESPDELEEIGFDEALQSGIALIEWPERLHGYPLTNLLQIEITVDPATEIRTLTLRPDPSWTDRLGNNSKSYN